jgi:hypothetical protein
VRRILFWCCRTGSNSLGSTADSFDLLLVAGTDQLECIASMDSRPVVADPDGMDEASGPHLSADFEVLALAWERHCAPVYDMPRMTFVAALSD